MDVLLSPSLSLPYSVVGLECYYLVVAATQTCGYESPTNSHGPPGVGRARERGTLAGSILGMPEWLSGRRALLPNKELGRVCENMLVIRYLKWGLL